MNLSIRRLLLIFSVAFVLPFISLQKALAAEVFFSQVYKGVGNTYGEETSSITINSGTLLVGTNFSFVSYNANDASFSGNNVVGYLKYIDASGQPVSILVNATRPIKNGSTAQGLYFVAVKVDANGNALDASNNIIADPSVSQNSLVYTGDAYTYVVFGQESYFSANTNIGSSSDRVDTFLNGLLSQPKIITTGSFSAFSSCSGSASVAQTVTVEGQNLGSNPITVTAPAGYEASLSAASGYAASLTLTPVSGAVATTTIYLRLSAGATSGATGALSFSATGVATRTILTGTATVNALPTITVNPAAPTIFPGGDVSLTASGATTYSWSPSTALSASTGATVTANPGSSTTYTVTGTDGNGCIGTATVTVTVGAALSGGSIGSNQAICEGKSPAQLTSAGDASGGSGTYSYQWQSSTDNTNFTDINTATASTYTSGALNVTTYFRRKVSDGVTVAYSNTITVTVNPKPATPTIIADGSTSFCAGGSVKLTSSSATGNQWYKDGAAITGENGQTYTATTTGTYTVMVTSSAGCDSEISGGISVTSNPIPSTPTITAGGPTTFCDGGSVTLTSSSATGNQWYKDGAIITGETGQTYTATTTGTYTLVVTSSAGCESAASAGTSVTANPIPSAPASISGNTLVIQGSAQTYSVAAVAGATSYTWILPNGWTGTSTTNSINVTAGSANGNISVTVTVSNCTSPAATLAVTTDTDNDGDGLSDSIDLDDDNDGILDTVEGAACSPADPNCDTDGDGTPNKFDLDSDGDGIPDVVESNGTDANKDGKADGAVDANGIPASAGTGNTPPDTDSDGKTDPYDVDSDADGIPDSVEKGADGNSPVDTDGDGTPDYRDLDSDNDGIPDSVEKGADGTKPVDTDGDGTPDYQDLDSDNDGIPDSVEKGADGTKPVDTDGDGTPDYRDLDSDNDGIPDSVEKGADGTKPVDTDGDGTPDYRDLDSDNDGIPDSIERGPDGTKPLDTDGDGTPDYRDLDSDNDGIPDSIEKGADGTKPVDTDGDGTPDYRDLDSDNDGIPDSVEKGADGTKPVDTDGDGTPDYRDLDSDNDGIPDAIERGPDGTKPLDTDKDGIPDYRDLDSDNDGIPDAIERGPDGTKPLDTDGDGTPDYRDLDSDNDGIPDADEVGPDPTKPLDSDGDGIPDYRELDSNNDGIPDSETLLIFKTATKPVLATDGSFSYTYTITLRNARKEVLNSVQVKEDLTKTFVSPMSFSVTGVKVSAGLTAAAGFDGRSQVNLLGSGVSLPGFAKETIEITVKVLPNGFGGNVNNTADGSAVAKWFNVTRQSIDTTASNGRKYGAGVPTVTVLPNVDIKIADVITPNNDGYNDKWVILRPSNVKVGVTIFNRWGQVIYKTTDYKNDWNGTSTSGFLGNQLPNGTYFYVVELTGGAFTTKDVRKGYLTLKRDF